MSQGKQEVNWYDELISIHGKTPIEAIAFEGKIHSSVDEIKDHINYFFNGSYGGDGGFAFTAWTADRVYFPACYGGAVWIATVDRNPVASATTPVGGG